MVQSSAGIVYGECSFFFFPQGYNIINSDKFGHFYFVGFQKKKTQSIVEKNRHLFIIGSFVGNGTIDKHIFLWEF